jgi:hypothetical protein
MHIEAELDDLHAERLLQWQQRIGKPLSEIVTEILSRALDEPSAPPFNSPREILRLQALDRLGRLSIDFGGKPMDDREAANARR